ncbi:BspA family leucine-rich repeat surface protein [Planktomarina sp.]|uniref:BspA family leucine-rich repeat surface protein n=1 Tax=Planktomarina sp. TaxID=2024851 RepID=UPI003C72FFE9
MVSAGLAVSPASAQFLSDGVTPVTPLTTSDFVTAVTQCTIESPVTGICPIYGDASGFGDMENWDTSLVTDMSFGLSTAPANFNGNISGWNTGNVTAMRGLFRGKTAFNQNIGNWNTSNVTDMYEMFADATAFNQDIGNWSTSNVTDMGGMFKYASAFDQDIGRWNTTSLTNLWSTFAYATLFNQNLNNWNTSNVTDMESAFEGAVAFNGDIKNWNTSGVTTFSYMFYDATAFNQDIGAWTVANVTDMSGMFYNAASFNQDISQWNTANVTTMEELFYNTPFTHDISGWSVSSVTNMRGMFEGTPFNHNIAGWNVSNVQGFANMFKSNAAFDQEIRGWSVGSSATLTDMFLGSTAFSATYGAASGFGTTPTAGFFTRSSDATLASLSVANSISPITVAPGTTSYFATIPFQNSASITLTVNQYSSAQASYASVTVDGTPVNLNATGTGTQSVILTAQPNAGQTVNIVVTAPDGSTLAYSLTIFHQSNDATLAQISLSAGSLSPSFASGTFSYTATVANSVNSVLAITIPNEFNATILINGGSSQSVPLSQGNNVVSIQVTSQDGTSVLTYTVNIMRQSNDASLSALSLSSGSLSPSFASGTTAYTASVANSVSSITVSPTTSDANATVTVNGAAPTTPVSLAVGSNAVTVQVTAQDGFTTQSYTVAVTRAAALTVALTGPSGAVTGPFTVTALFSDPVVSFVASDVTVVNGQITSVTGSGTSYAIAVTPVLGQQVSVSVAAGVVSTSLGTLNQLSNTLLVQAGSPATALAAHQDELAEVIRREAGRELRAGLAADQRMVRAGFQRLIASRRSIAGGVNSFVPFDITGTASYSQSSFRTNGQFFALSTVGGKQWHRVAFGNFDFLSDSLGSSSGYLTARLAFETEFSEDVMLGYYVGADIGKAKVGGTFNGTQNSLGLTLGGYFSRIYDYKLIVSGFASIGQRQHDFDASNNTLAVSSDYRTAIGRVGGMITGFIEHGTVAIWPELAFNIARTGLGSIPISGTAYGLTNHNLSLDAGGVDLASISFTPHVKLKAAEDVIPGYRLSFSMGPKISCEAVHSSSLTKDCGSGAVFGMTMLSNDGVSIFEGDLEYEDIGGTERKSLNLLFKRQF